MDKHINTIKPADREAETREDREKPKSAEETEAINQEIIQENFQRLLGEARSFITTQKQKKRLREDMQIRAWEKKQLAQLPTEAATEMQIEEASDNLNVNSFKNKLRLLNLKMKKVENPKEMVKLIDYLENNAPDETRNFLFFQNIPESELEELKKKMEKKGYVIERQNENFFDEVFMPSKEKKYNLNFKKIKEANYEFSSHDLGNLEKALKAFGGSVENFEEFFRNVKKIFPFLLNYVIGWRSEDELKALAEIMEISNSREIMAKLLNLGFRKESYSSDIDVNRLIRLVKKESEENFLTPEVINKIKILRQKLPSRNIIFDDLEVLISFVQDNNFYRRIVLNDLIKSKERVLTFSEASSLFYEENKKEECLKLSSLGADDPFSCGENLKNYLSKEADYLAVSDILVLSGSKKKSKEDLTKIFAKSNFLKDEKFLALFQLFKENNLLNFDQVKVFDAENFNKSTTGKLNNPLLDQIEGLEKVMKRFGDSVFHPDFENYLKKLQPFLGGEYIFNDLTGDGRSYLTEIFDNQELRNKVLSSEYSNLLTKFKGKHEEKLKNLYLFLELKQGPAEIEAEYEHLSLVFGDLKYDDDFYAMLDDDYRRSFPEDLFYFFQIINFKGETRYFRGHNWAKVKDEILFTFRDRQSMEEIAPYFRELHFQNILDVEKALAYVRRLALVPKEKKMVYFQVIKGIEGSLSPEILRLSDELIPQILQTDKPVEIYRKIEDVFIKNNLPLVGKIFNVFSILYPAQRVGEMLKNKNFLSPYLTKAGPTRRKSIIYEDLLNVNLRSGNRSLRDYFLVLEEGREILDKVDEIGVQSLSTSENGKFKMFLNKFQTLFDNSQLGRNAKAEGEVSDIQDLAERYEWLRDRLKVKEGQKINDRISQMFLRPVGLGSITEALSEMEKAKKGAHQRGLETFETAQRGELKLKEGDLLKGVDSSYISLILENGSVAKEYLGAGADSDMTPFDTDLSRVMAEDVGGDLNKIVLSSLASGYGDLIFAVKDRGQFYKTASGGEVDFQNKKLELFKTGYHGPRHYGIRTGFPTTEIDFMVMMREYSEGEKENLFFEIAKNGFYIPILDKQGVVVFTPEMFEERSKILHPELSIERKDFDEVMNKKYEPSKLIDLLKIDFGNQFASTELGISEGYSLEQHTLMVLGQYEKYFKDFDSPIDIADEKFMRLLLALHDIGKPNAVKMESKHDQHKYSTVIVEEIMSQLKYSRREINLSLAILSGDYVGKYAQGQMDVDIAVREIKRVALAEHVEPKDFLELLLVYFQSDASSYTKDAGGIESLDYLFVFNHQEGKMDFSSDLKSKIEELRREVAS